MPVRISALSRSWFLPAILLLLLLCVLSLRAETVVTSLEQFRNLPLDAKDQPITYRLECLVTYYDDDWNSLWVQDAASAAYVNPGSRPLPIRAGQRIRAFGTLPNARELSFAGAIVQILGEETPVPVPLENRVDQVAMFNNRLVAVDALVDRPAPFAAEGHQQYLLSLEGRPALAWLRLAPGESAPELANTRVHLTGVYNPSLDPTGALAGLQLMVASSAQIRVLARLAEDPRFAITRTPIDRLPECPANALVRVIGHVVGHEPGISLQLRDDTGQLEVRNAQTLPCAIGTAVEAIGYPRVVATNWQLYDPTYRLLAQPEVNLPSPDARQPLRLAAQIEELSLDAAATARPVRLAGVVTWAHLDAPFFFLQDASGGIRVFRDRTDARICPAGRRVEVVGTTRLGPFAPAVDASDIVKLGDSVLPSPAVISLERAMTGAEEARYVELRGYVRDLVQDGPWNRLTVATPSGDFTAHLAASEPLGPVVDSVVRLRGVCSAAANEQRQLRGVDLWLSDASAIQITEPALPDQFSRPLRKIETLGRYGSIQTHEHRLRIRGSVTHQEPGERVDVIEDVAALVVLSRTPARFTPGDQIEAVGFLGRQGARLALHESVVRKIGTGPLPPPAALTPEQWMQPAWVGRLVSVEGQLISTADAGDRTRLTIQSGNTLAEAYLSGPAGSWSIGSRVRLIGAHDLQYDAYNHPSLLRLNLRTAADVVVLRLPPWFTRGRILVVAGVLALGALLAGLWGAALRRRVRRQTDQIRLQLERESRLEAELQRTSKLEALGLLAGGIAHDFNNLLTVVMGNLSLMRGQTDLEPDTVACIDQAEQAVGRSRDLTMQLLTFAKGGNPVRTAVSLSEVVQEVTRFTLHGSNVRANFTAPPDLWPADVDKGQISQVVQNIVINAVQAMAQGGRLDLDLANEEVTVDHRLLAAGRYIRLTISDTGPGIPPHALPRIFDPYFTTKKAGHGIGLATVHSIVKKHQGHITVSSPPGGGARFQIWLPAAPSPLPGGAPPPPAAPVAATNRGRALVLDDEEPIRRLATAMLKHLGFETIAVSDGADAIRTYAAARHEGRPFKLVILDLTIPGGVGGEETIRELRRIDPEVCAIVSSGYSNNPVLSDHRAFGFKGMVSKPYELNDLALVVEELLGNGPPH